MSDDMGSSYAPQLFAHPKKAPDKSKLWSEAQVYFFFGSKVAKNSFAVPRATIRHLSALIGFDRARRFSRSARLYEGRGLMRGESSGLDGLSKRDDVLLTTKLRLRRVSGQYRTRCWRRLSKPSVCSFPVLRITSTTHSPSILSGHVPVAWPDQSRGEFVRTKAHYNGAPVVGGHRLQISSLSVQGSWLRDFAKRALPSTSAKCRSPVIARSDCPPLHHKPAPGRFNSSG